MPFSELVSILRNEKIIIPADLAGANEDQERNLLSLFVNNTIAFSGGLKSNWKSDTAESFMYKEVGLKLIPFGLVHFEKLPAAQAKFFKRLVASPEGNKFLLHYKRIKAQPTEVEG